MWTFTNHDNIDVQDRKKCEFEIQITINSKFW